MNNKINWEDSFFYPFAYLCGHCLVKIRAEKGRCGVTGLKKRYNDFFEAYDRAYGLYYCTECGKPTYFEGEWGLALQKDTGRDAHITTAFLHGIQIPAPSPVNRSQHAPDEIKNSLEEAITCFSTGAYTACAMICRKTIMNVCVDLQHKEGLTFQQYVDWLNTENYIPKGAKDCITKVRKLGNESTHKVDFMTKSQAETALIFIEFLLENVYECKGRLANS